MQKKLLCLSLCWIMLIQLIKNKCKNKNGVVLHRKERLVMKGSVPFFLNTLHLIASAVNRSSSLLFDGPEYRLRISLPSAALVPNIRV